MTFVSYAQNYEDVILARVLRGVAAGFYIDVGAQDPRFDSVTKAFYDQGWRGINIEPVRHWCDKLAQERPRDINLCIAAGAAAGTCTLYEISDSGLSTGNAEFAARHRLQGLDIAERQVPVQTLDEICSGHGIELVHFLKIDVEGAEAEVLRGISLESVRPWVIVVEATEPNSRVSTHGQWQSLLLDRGYRFVYQDGLNRFYLANEHTALASAFDEPPNVFDQFIRREFVDKEALLRGEIADIDALSHRRAAYIDELVATVGLKDDAIALLHGERAEVDALNHAHGQAQHRRIADLEAQLQVSARQLESSERSAARMSQALVDLQTRQMATAAALAVEAAGHRRTQAALADLQFEHQRVIDSRSWRLTGPLRGLNARLAAAAVRLADSARATARHRWPRRMAAAALAPFPAAAARIKRHLYGVVEDSPAATVAAAPLPLTEDAENILAKHPVSRARAAPERNGDGD